MKGLRGVLFPILSGGFITLQGVANARISQDIGTWQAVTLTQLTGFVAALIIFSFVRDGHFQDLKAVKPLYLISGAFASVIIVSNITIIGLIGVTLSASTMLIAQLCLTFLIDSKGWFDVVKQRMKLPQFIGIGMMLAGVIILKL